MNGEPATAATSRWRFERLDSVSAPGRSVNEDRASATAQAAWVIDGVTGLSSQRLFPGPSDAAWLAAAADASLHDLADFAGDGHALLRQVTARLRQESARAALRSLDEAGLDLPAASVAVARLSGDDLETTMLSDCKILLGHRGGTVTALDQSPVAPFDAAVVAALRALRAQGETRLSDVTPRLQAIIRDNRRWVNKPGGYGVLSADPAGLAFVEVRRWPAADVTHVLLASDGFYRLVDTYRVLEPKDLLRNAVAGGLAPLYAELRRIEAADSECLAHPRLKPQDDATALLLQVIPPPH